MSKPAEVQNHDNNPSLPHVREEVIPSMKLLSAIHGHSIAEDGRNAAPVALDALNECV